MFCTPSMQHARGHPQSLKRRLAVFSPIHKMYHPQALRALPSNDFPTRQRYREFLVGFTAIKSLRQSNRASFHLPVPNQRSYHSASSQAHANQKIPCGSRCKKRATLNTPLPTVFHVPASFTCDSPPLRARQRRSSENSRRKVANCDAKRAHPRPSHASRPSKDHPVRHESLSGTRSTCLSRFCVSLSHARRGGQTRSEAFWCLDRV